MHRPLPIVPHNPPTPPTATPELPAVTEPTTRPSPLAQDDTELGDPPLAAATPPGQHGPAGGRANARALYQAADDYRAYAANGYHSTATTKAFHQGQETSRPIHVTEPSV